MIVDVDAWRLVLPLFSLFTNLLYHVSIYVSFSTNRSIFNYYFYSIKYIVIYLSDQMQSRRRTNTKLLHLAATRDKWNSANKRCNCILLYMIWYNDQKILKLFVDRRDMLLPLLLLLLFLQDCLCCIYYNHRMHQGETRTLCVDLIVLQATMLLLSYHYHYILFLFLLLLLLLFLYSFHNMIFFVRDLSVSFGHFHHLTYVVH